MQELQRMNHSPEGYTPAPQVLNQLPSLRFALEMAQLDLDRGGHQQLFPSAFASGQDGIPINGLVWMGTAEEMARQAQEKINAGFSCIKLKIGSLDFREELQLIRTLRESHPEIELRVDANGGLTRWYDKEKLQVDTRYAEECMEHLARFKVHSVEQPVFASAETYAQLCAKNILPIALDEQLIGIMGTEAKRNLLDAIRPQFIVLKPTLLGGFEACNEWIELARKSSTGWWITSALESNVGLNAIAQWTATLNNPMPQGLGTGSLFTNNITSPMYIREDKLWYNPKQAMRFDGIFEP